MQGKEKCKALKEIRRKIAEDNDIAYVVSECTHQGDCKGTCPKCEAELAYLERELNRRQKLGKTVAVVGLSAGMAMSMTGCTLAENIGEVISDTYHSITGTQTLEGETEIEGGLIEEDPPESIILEGEATEEPQDDDFEGAESLNPEESNYDDESETDESDSEEDDEVIELEGDVAAPMPSEEE